MTEVPERRIEELNRELDTVRTERDRLNKEAIRWAEKRNLLHEDIKRLRSEARSLKEKRDELNRRVKHLKTLREEARKKRGEKISHLKELRQKTRDLTAKRPKRSAQSLENEIEKIEWKIQTDSLSLDEERKLIERVKSLETQLEAYREIKNVKNKILTLQEEVETLKKEISSRNEEISEVAKQSQRFHEKMIEKLEKIKELQAEADAMHKRYVENKEKAKAFHSKYVETLGQIKGLREIIRKREEAEKAKQIASLRKKLEKEALDKLRRGEKLTFEEFKLLAEQGKI